MASAHYAYCSWCFKKTWHHLTESNYLSRNIYKCENCGERTVECRMCKNMAKGGKWDDEFCAEHDGTIANFSKLDMKLSDISNYSQIFKRNTINAPKVAAFAAFIIGGAVVLGPLAFSAAPAIGGAIGSRFMGLSGAAATNAGLAAIGGGTIASGGLGMAGGVAIIGATGAALGGTLGGVVSNSYFSDVEGFDIELIKTGCEPKVIFIDGFLTQKNPKPADWISALTKIYPDNAWYYLRWESKRLYDIGKSFGDAVSKKAASKLIERWAMKASKQAAKNVGPLWMVMTAIGIASNPWSVASVKAGQTGILLADLIARTDSTYILCGHSLGARVIYYALQNLTFRNHKCIDTVHLLGGAIGNDPKEWEKICEVVCNNVNNYYSDKDWVLASFYKVGTFMLSTPIGRNPIGSNHPALNDHDVSAVVTGHTRYKDNFHHFVKV